MFGSKKHHGKTVAVFDVSSSSVGGAHALITPKKDANAHVTLLAEIRQEGVLQEDIDMKRFVSDAMKNIASVATALQKADSHKPEHIELVLASPWYVSQTRRVTYKQDLPFVCTKKLIAKIVDEEIAHIVKNELEKFGAYGKEGTIVEKQISLVKLNGYATGDPFGKRAHTIDLFLTVTVAPKKIIDDFADTLKHTYGSRPISITTSPFATFVVARDFLNNGHECVIIDVGEEVTDIGFVTNGLFTYQHSFPVGTYALYRTLTEKGDHTPIEAKAVVEAYRLEKLSATAKTKVSKAVTAFADDWQQGLQKAFEEGHYGFCLPQTCYITADARFEGVFPSIITNDTFIQQTCSRGPVTPVFITEAMLTPFVSSIDTTFDIALATAALFASRNSTS